MLSSQSNFLFFEKNCIYNIKPGTFKFSDYDPSEEISVFWSPPNKENLPPHLKKARMDYNNIYEELFKEKLEIKSALQKIIGEIVDIANKTSENSLDEDSDEFNDVLVEARDEIIEKIIQIRKLVQNNNIAIQETEISKLINSCKIISSEKINSELNLLFDAIEKIYEEISKEIIVIIGEAHSLRLNASVDRTGGLIFHTENRLQDALGAKIEAHGATGVALRKSAITEVDGKKGTLRYRGYTVSDIKNLEPTAVMQLIHGRELPSKENLDNFNETLNSISSIPKEMIELWSKYPTKADSMKLLSSIISSLKDFDRPEIEDLNKNEIAEVDTVNLIAKMPLAIALINAIKRNNVEDFIKNMNLPEYKNLGYVEKFLFLYFGKLPDQSFIKFFKKYMIYHMDHCQNLSTQGALEVTGAGGDMYSAVANAINLLNCPAHGRATYDVIETLKKINKFDGDNIHDKVINFLNNFIESKKTNKNLRIPGFGHKIYKAYDSRAIGLKEAGKEINGQNENKNVLFEIAEELEKQILENPEYKEFFKKRNLYPNVDFYSGSILSANGIHEDMLTCMFALSRATGWTAQCREFLRDPRMTFTRAESNSRVMNPRETPKEIDDLKAE